MEKIIINQNKKLQDEAVNKTKALASKINISLQNLKDETGFAIDSQDLLTLASNSQNSDRLYDLKEKLNTCLNKQLDDLKITAKLMRDNFKSGAGDKINNAAKEISLGVANIVDGSSYLHKLVIEDGKAVLTEQTEQEIRESFILSIDTESGKQLFDLQNEAANIIERLFNYVNKNTIVHFTLPEQMISQLFNYDYDQKTIKPAEMDYNRITTIKK